MQKKIAITFCLLLVCFPFFAQSSDPVILSYQRNFVRASITTKLDLLNDASRITTVNMTPLYADAIAFVQQNYALLGSDSQLMDIATVAATKVASYGDITVLPALRTLFSTIDDTHVRLACLDTFAILIPKKPEETAALNDWFSSAIGAPGTVNTPDAKTLAACATTLGKIGNLSSFDVLFRAATSNTDSSVVSAATDALNSLDAGYADKILGIIANKDIQKSYAAFSFAMKKNSLPASDQGKIAEAAFNLASADSAAVPAGALLKAAMEQLTKLSWSPASSAMTKYFYRQQDDYKNGKTDINDLLPVIRCMGAMKTTEAAQALSIFLGLLNSETEQKKTYNEQLMLVVIQALGDLGDKSAFDYLLYVGYLDYPESVKKASRDALARLAW
jgi:HEAT repeat protein